MSGFPMQRVKEVLLRLLPDDELEFVKEIPLGRVTRQFTLNLASKQDLLLGLSPTVKTKLLRHEQNLLTSEAVLVTFLRDGPVSQESDSDPAQSRALPPFTPQPSSSRHLSPHSAPLSTSRLSLSAPLLAPTPLPSPHSHASIPTLTPFPPITSFLPTIIHHEPTTTDLGYQYTIYEPPLGSPLSAIECTQEELYAVNLQLGQLAHNMATITSPNGTFGPALKVLGASGASRPLSPASSPLLSKSPISAQGSSSSSRRPSQTPSPLPFTTGAGSATWDVAFNVLFESVLRDGEDLTLNLPFTLIRTHIKRLSYVLKTITVPRLLLFDAGDEDKILVFRPRSSSSSSSFSGQLHLSGFSDMTTGIFGDPLLSSFWEDWDASGPRREGWGEGCKFIDKKTLPVRLMLYRCYRACVDVVREYYRPRKDSSEREMIARRRLAVVLRELDGVVVGKESDFATPSEAPHREGTKSMSPAARLEATESATPKRAQNEASTRQKTSPRKKPKLEVKEDDSSGADDEKEDESGDESDHEVDNKEERYQSPIAATRPNPADIHYILNN